MDNSLRIQIIVQISMTCNKQKYFDYNSKQKQDGCHRLSLYAQICSCTIYAGFK